MPMLASSLWIMCAYRFHLTGWRAEAAAEKHKAEAKLSETVKQQVRAGRFLTPYPPLFCFQTLLRVFSLLHCFYYITIVY